MRKPILLTLAVGLTLSLPALAAQPATWRSIGPDGGTVYTLAFAPSDPHVAYAGTFGGGVFRSGDGGASWTAVNGGLGSDLFALALAVDPHDSRTVYAGVGGLYKTTSGGASWSLLSLRSSGFLPSVTAVQIDPTRPRILYAVTDSGVFRSADGGAHWAERDAGLPGRVSALDLDPDHPDTLYAGVFDKDAFSVIPAVYKTTDGGGSWTVLPGVRTSYVVALARQRSTGTLYASTFDGLFATRDGGATWTHPNLGGDIGPIVAAPAGNLLYGGFLTRGVLSSTDGGRTWNDPEPSSPAPPFGSVLSLALDLPGNRLLAGTNFTGIFSLDARSGWAPASRGLRATDVTGLALNSAGLFVSTLGEGVLVSGDGGASFSARNSGILPPGFLLGEIDVESLAADPKAPGSLVAGVASGVVAKTSDGGLHWAIATAVCLPADRLALASPATIFVSSSAPFFGGHCSQSVICTATVSRDGGGSFACLDGPQDVSAFLVDPLRPAIVYAAAGDAVWKSTDRGGRFTLVASGLGMTITTLASSPAAHQTLYAGSDRGALKSDDGGAHWRVVTPNLGAAAGVVVDPSNPSLVYATSTLVGQAGRSSQAVFVSRDGGASWSVLGDGFPATNYVGVLALDSARHVLYAGTEGNGVWALSLP